MGPSPSGPITNIWGPNTGQQHREIPCRATGGSAGVDLSATTRTVLTPMMGCQPIPVNMQGPLPPNTVGLILGRASVLLQGLTIHPGVIDSDYTGIIHVLCASPRGVASISPGDRIAQLLLLPSLHSKFPSHDLERGTKGLGSSGKANIFFSMNMNDRPQLVLTIQGKKFTGVLDTGADTSIIAQQWWPVSWPLRQASQTLRGLGYEESPKISAQELKWVDSEGNRGTFTPFVLPLPVNLWGRDVLKQLGCILTNDSHSKGFKLMEKMGYQTGKGLGKNEQGILEPLEGKMKLDRTGLGFI